MQYIKFTATFLFLFLTFESFSRYRYPVQIPVDPSYNKAGQGQISCTRTLTASDLRSFQSKHKKSIHIYDLLCTEPNNAVLTDDWSVIENDSLVEFYIWPILYQNLPTNGIDHVTLLL